MQRAGASDHGQERAELSAILSSRGFVRAPNVFRILAYVCEKYFEGDLGAIKEYTIAVEALGRPADFCPGDDSIVRVEVSRLRRRLREYYASEGAAHPLHLQFPESGYVPVFYPNGHGPPSRSLPESAGNEHRPEAAHRFSKRAVSIGTVVAIALATLATFSRTATHGSVSSGAAAPPIVPSVISSAQAIRIASGLTASKFMDSIGREWSSDRYVSGGVPIRCPDCRIAGTLDPAMYRIAREGDFRYDIPVKSGNYELHLHFSEIVYGDDNAESSGDGARRFHVRLNGAPLLTDFDIIRDANGARVADERVFTSVSPAPDGSLRLDFSSSVGKALLSGIEVLPIPDGPGAIRILSGSRSFVDNAGQFWAADRYFRGGRTLRRWTPVQGTPDPDIYSGERWGTFSYNIPVPDGTYTLDLLFAEQNFGSRNFGASATQHDGSGSRIFDVFCNGEALIRNLDVYREAGGPRRALRKSFHRLRPDARGKLWLSFVPVRDYATVSAIQVSPER